MVWHEERTHDSHDAYVGILYSLGTHPRHVAASGSNFFTIVTTIHDICAS